MRTRIKICGITRVEDALAAVDAGCDALGLVFYGPSPRCVSLNRARDIVSTVPPFVTVVGLFVDAEPETVATTLAQVPLGLLQFHGNESGEACRQYSLPYIKAIRVRERLDWTAITREYAGATGLLLDTYDPVLPGGTGKAFDWNRIPSGLSKPIVLAGGLSPNNVGQAIKQVKPFAVDVSGGVEKKKGEKDPEKILAFIREVRMSDEQR